MQDIENKISIIVPVYNAEKYLEKCISSIIGQSYTNLQILLIDDGSDDGSLPICERFSRKDSRIEVYHIENTGSVAARKYGLKLAQGKYIGFVDADDYVECNMFSELLRTLVENDADFVHSGYIEEIDGKQNIVANFDNENIDIRDFEDKMFFLQKHIFNSSVNDFLSYSLWSKLYKAELIKGCFQGLADEQQYGEDLLCFCRCILESKRVVLYKSAMYHYVVREKTLSHLGLEDYMMEEIGLWHYLIKVMKEYGCYEAQKSNLYYFFKTLMLHMNLTDKKIQPRIPRYYYKDICHIIGKKIVIFGAGDVGQDYYSQICKYRNCEIVAWVDSNWKKYHFDYAEVKNREEIVAVSYDMVIIAVMDKRKGMEIKSLLESMGVAAKQIEWQEPGVYYG